MPAVLHKTSPILIILLLISLSIFAQAPEKMSYQAVIRNGNDNLLVNQNIGVKISILQGTSTGTIVYSETHTAITNANGLVSLAIGEGTISFGSFTSINWANGPYFIKTETDPTGSDTYTISGSTELLSVPYALYAKTSGKVDREYAYIYNTAPHIVALESKVLFSNNGVITGGITHTPGTSDIILSRSGNYEISFSVSAIEPNQFALFINDVLVEGSTFGSGAGAQQNSGTVIISASGGDILSLRNHTSAAAVMLQALAGGTQNNTNAFIKITYLSD